MRKLVVNYNKGKKKDFFSCPVYYYETAHFNGVLAAFSDARGILLHLGDDFEVELNTYVCIPQQIRKADHSSSWDQIIEQSLQTGRGPESRTGFTPGVGLLLNALRRAERSGPLNLKNIVNYDSNVYFDTDSVAYLEFTSKIEEGFSGKIYYKPRDYQIDSMSFSRCHWYSEQHNREVQGWVKIIMSEKGHPFPEIIQGGYIMDEIDYKVKLKTLRNVDEHHVVDPGIYNSFLFYSVNPTIVYRESDWHEMDTQIRDILPLDLYEEIKTEKRQKQFKENHGKPYYTYTYRGMDYPDITEMGNLKDEVEKQVFQ